MTRLRPNFERGTLTSNITSGATTLASGAFSALPTVASPDYLSLTLDPDATAGNPEIVWVTAHTSSSTSVTVTRGREGTLARSHQGNVTWHCGPTGTGDFGFESEAVQYVSTNSSASDSNDGFSWRTAKATIDGAIAALPTITSSHRGRIEVDGGSFTVTSTPGLLDFVEIRGMGWINTFLNFSSGLTGLDCTNIDFASFSDLSIVGSGGGSIGLKANATTYNTFRNVRINGFETGVAGSNLSDDLIFDNVRVTGATNGITANNCRDWNFRSLEVSASGVHVALTQTQAVTFFDWRGSGGTGFLTLAQGSDACRDTTLIGCDLEDSSTSPFISATDAGIYNLTVIGSNFASASGTPAARCIEFGGKGITVLGNTFNTFSSNPVLLDSGADGGFIASNTYNNTASGVVTDNSTAHTVTYLNEVISRLGRAIVLPAGTTAAASLRLPHGSAPTSPVDGDMWTTTAGLYVRVNGATVGPLS